MAAAQRSLLTLLLLNAGEVVSADRLIDLLWGERAPESGRTALQVRISQLRKALGHKSALVVTRAPGYLLRVDPEAFDLYQFERLMEEASGAEPAIAALRLREALDLWRGDPLADLAYEVFAQPAIQRLQELRLTALERRIEADLALGRHADLVAELESLVAEHRWRERLHQQLMLALYRCGRQADALAVYQRVRQVLVEELAIEPGARLRELERAVLLQDASLELVSRAPPGGEMPAVSDGAARRPSEEPELRHNLPAEMSSFVGRERELRDLAQLLLGVRVLTLSGAGGVGKTRLAVQVAAHTFDGTGDGVWFVDLAPLSDPTLVPAKVATVLGVRERPGQELTDTLLADLRTRRLLVILDNCEHLIESAARLAEQLVCGCPGVVILATSREPLRIAGEHVYRIPSLPVPAPGVDDRGALAYAAVRLFVDRAAQQRADSALGDDDLAVVGRICRRLDGIPLAIELAAARRRSLPLDELDRRLDQRFALLTVGTRTALARQQTLEALIDWSYDLLEPAEQALFERLSVFAGGFDLDAAEAVAGATGQFSADVLDRVAALVDKSLVQVNDGATTRYSLLESVREYAAIRLAARGPAAVEAVSAAHRDHYLALAELAAPRLLRSDQGEWLDRLELELDNLRATIAECALAADPELGLRLGRALYQFWLKRRPQAEGVAAVCKALDRLDARAPTAVRGLALAAAGYLLVEIAGDHRAAAARAEEALEIGLTLADDRIRAEALLDLAAASWREADDAAFLARCDAALEAASAVGDPHLTAVLLMRRAGSHLRSPEDTARDAEQSLELFLQAGDPSGILYSLINISYRELWTGQIAAAHDRLSEAIEIARTTGQRRYLMHALFNLGLALHLDRADADARPYFDEALHIASQDGNPLMEAYCQLGLALLASRAGDLATAAMLHGQADAIHEKLGTRVEGLESGLREADVGRLRSVLGQREFDSAYLAGREPMRSVGQR